MPEGTSLPSDLTGDRWRIYPLSDDTLGAVPATVTDEAVEAAGEVISGWVVDPSKGGPRDMLRAALTAALGSLQAAPVRANNGGGIEVMRASEYEDALVNWAAIAKAAMDAALEAEAQLERLREVTPEMVFRLVRAFKEGGRPVGDGIARLALRAALGEPSHETGEEA